MKYDVSGILKNDGARLEFDKSVSPDELGLGSGEIEVIGEIGYKGKITNISRVLKLDADITINYKAPCGRCLADVQREEKIHIDVDFPNIDETNDKDEYCYSSGLLDLTGVVNDSIFTALPFKHVCSDECKGLCPMCGQELNVYNCNCEHNVIDERFAVLKKYFD
jgi:uncharacterized protein